MPAKKRRRRKKPIPRVEQQHHPCLCGYMCARRSVMVMHHKTCEQWLSRPDPRALSIYRRQQTVEQQRKAGLGHKNQKKIQQSLAKNDFTPIELSNLFLFFKSDFEAK